MDKAFVVEEGHEVRCGHVWHRPGLLVLVEPHQSVEIYLTIDGKRGEHVGSYVHAELDLANLPQGLTVRREA